MTTHEHLTEREVEAQYAPLFSLNRQQAWRALKQGPRFVRIGRRIFYKKSEIESFIAANVVETAGPH